MSATLRSRPLGRLPAPDPGLQGRELGPGAVPDARLIDSLKRAVPDGLEEVTALAKTLTSRSQDVLAHYRPPSYLQRPHRGGGRTPGAPGRHRPGIPQPHPLHHPQPHPHWTPQRPPESNHLNPTINPTYNTLKHEEPENIVVSAPEDASLRVLPDDDLTTPKPRKKKQKPTPWGFYDVGLSARAMVGVAGFEPTTSSSRTKRATKLRHTPRAADDMIVVLSGRMETLLKRHRSRTGGGARCAAPSYVCAAPRTEAVVFERARVFCGTRTT